MAHSETIGPACFHTNSGGAERFFAADFPNGRSESIEMPIKKISATAVSCQEVRTESLRNRFISDSLGFEALGDNRHSTRVFPALFHVRIKGVPTIRHEIPSFR